MKKIKIALQLRTETVRELDNLRAVVGGGTNSRANGIMICNPKTENCAGQQVGQQQPGSNQACTV